ncbi:Branchpoint-bridging protein [Fusarium sp. LHS14.1]|nr:Branchpoint-bridging protein [Fusarium sp. LHS14.1]
MTRERPDAYVVIFHVDKRADKSAPANSIRLIDTGLRLEEERYSDGGNCHEGHSRLSSTIRLPPVYDKTSKVYLPVTEFQSVNLFGQIFRPRESSLDAMNAESGANIVPHGSDSVEKGKGRSRLKIVDNDREPLHYLITADCQPQVYKAKKLIQGVIETATSTPEDDIK